MPTETLAGSPEVSATAENKSVAATPVAAPVPSKSDLATRLASASNPLEITKLLDELRSSPAPQKAATTAEAPPAEKTAEAKPSEADAPAEEVASEETPKGETAEEDKSKTTAEDETLPPEGDEDMPVVPLKSRRAHLTLPPQTDEVGRLTLAFVKRNPDWTLDQARDAARNKLGIKDPAPAKSEATAAKTEEAPDNGMPKSVDATVAKIAELRAARKAASVDLKFDEVATLNDQIEDLLQHRVTLDLRNERQAAEQEAQQSARYDADFGKSVKRAGDLYPFAADPESEGGKRMKEIDDALKDSEDPLFYSPNKPLVVAQMVARELRIAPKVPGAKPAAAKPATTAPATEKPKSRLPEGGATTSPQKAGDSANKLAETLASVRTTADFNKIADRLGIMR